MNVDEIKMTTPFATVTELFIDQWNDNDCYGMKSLHRHSWFHWSKKNTYSWWLYTRADQLTLTLTQNTWPDPYNLIAQDRFLMLKSMLLNYTAAVAEIAAEFAAEI